MENKIVAPDQLALVSELRNAGPLGLPVPRILVGLTFQQAETIFDVIIRNTTPQI
jgi:hypothetical protein